MKTLKLLFCLLLSQITLAQSSFFETILKNGKNAVYQEYYSVSKYDKGKTKISGKRFEVKIEPVYFKGITAGFNMIKIEDGKNLNAFNVSKDDYEELKGYPNVSHLIHTRKNSGFVAIDKYIFKLNRITNDGLSFSSIDAIYILKEVEKTTKKGKKKKKKRGGFFKKLGNAALKVATNVDLSKVEKQSPELKKAASLDLKKLVKDYLISMNEKQNNYKLSTKDKTDIAALKKSIIDHKAYIKRYNDSVWRTPEYQRILENNRRAKSAGKRNNVTLINKTGKKLLIINSETNTSTMDLGNVSKTWMCSRNAYIGRKISNGSTITYKIIRKVYTANSKCGGKVIIN